LIDACHQRKLGVILDVVYNHLGPEGNYLGKFGPYFHEHSATPWGEAVNLDGNGSEFVRRFFIDNALMWLRDYHCDGLRVDATHAFVDQSPTPFLAQFATEVKALSASLGRQLFLIAESDLNDPRIITSLAEGGWGFDAQGNEDFHHALHTLLTGENFGYYMDYGQVTDLGKVLSENFCLHDRFSKHRQKMYGHSAKGIESSRFIAFAQNHDQIGNRGTGERLSHLVSAGQVKLGAAVTLLAPFIPMLFQGEEWSASTPFYYFADLTDPEIRAAMREGRQAEFALPDGNKNAIPDPLEESTWRRSQLDWDERESGKHHDILAWYCALLRFRKQEPDFAPGSLDLDGIAYEEALGWLSFRRGRYRVICNFSDTPQLVTRWNADLLELVMTSEQGVQILDKGISLPGYSVAVLAQLAGRHASVQGG
jgi:maltooligosyltrehalose trehalohydrolase